MTAQGFRERMQHMRAPDVALRMRSGLPVCYGQPTSWGSSHAMHNEMKPQVRAWAKWKPCVRAGVYHASGLMSSLGSAQ